MNILIATSRFEDLAGSEITVLEYAIELIESGNKVSIASFSYSDRYEAECVSNGIKLSTIDDEQFIKGEWDLIWVFHHPTFYALFSKWKYASRHVIFSSLSHFEPLEAPPLEVKTIDLFTVNSRENYDSFSERYSQYSNRLIVLPNSVPRGFWQKIDGREKNKKIAIVSNHIPEEIIGLKLKLEEAGWEVDIFGIGHKEQRVNTDLLAGYNFCISIGKTVQYCLAMKIPVFCYDHFGGPGWINLENIKLSSDYNFSGRCTNQRCSAEYLFEMFRPEFIPDDEQLAKLQLYAQEHFNLTKNISHILSTIKNNRLVGKNTSETEHNILSKSVDVFVRDSIRQKELANAFTLESQKRLNTENRLVEFKTAWDTENSTRLRIEKELLEVNFAWELEKNSHKKTIEKLEMLENMESQKGTKKPASNTFLSAIIERIKGYKN